VISHKKDEPMQSQQKSAAEIQAEKLIKILEAAIRLNKKMIRDKRREMISSLCDTSGQLN
jgi:hypothetical protein